MENRKLIYQILRLGRKYDSDNEDSKSTIIDELEALVDEHNKKLYIKQNAKWFLIGYFTAIVLIFIITLII